VLRSFAPKLSTKFFLDRFSGGDDGFDVLEYGGGPPPPELGGPKDTLYLQPGKTARIATRFGDYADPDHPYMFHCRLLAHDDRGMMGQVVMTG
jgi:FtsP/CotA-like multicopper oxidase with cupredoxin domain